MKPTGRTHTMDPTWIHSKFSEIDTQWEKFLKGDTPVGEHINNNNNNRVEDVREDDATQDRSSSTHDLFGESFLDDRESGNESGSSRREDRKVSFADEKVFADERDNSPHSFSSRVQATSNPSSRQGPPSPETTRSTSRSPSPTMEGYNSDNIDMFKMFDIFKTCERRNWQAFVSQVNSYPAAASVHVSSGSRGIQLASQGNMLLHEVCRNDPTLEVIDTLLVANRSAVSLKGHKGYLPLHFACSSGAAADVVARLIRAYPESVKARDGTDLMLPLHLACKWGASKNVFDMLIREHPSARTTRDIYAKSPLDYATRLGSHEERDIAIACLGTKVTEPTKPKEPIYNSRSTLFNDNEKPVRVELKVAKSKMEELSQEIANREHEFALIFGQEQKKANELEREREQLLGEAKKSKDVLDTQAKQLELLEAERGMLQSLQETHRQKREVLEKKVLVLEEALAVKEDLISRLEHENNFKYKQQLTKTLQGQEAKFTQLLQTERDRVAQLERRAQEVEVTQRLYTKALMAEHDRDAENFEELTLQFKEIEKNLRDDIKKEVGEKKSLQAKIDEMAIDHQLSVQKELEKVSFLERHVTKVNNLLKTEQARFQELEGILQEALTLEQEQREEMAEEWSDKEKEYENTISEERLKIKTLEADYTEVRELLKTEHGRVGQLEGFQTQLQAQIESEKQKFQVLLDSHMQAEARLQEEKDRNRELEYSESEARAELKVEQEKVKQLEAGKLKIQELLDEERKNFAELKQSYETKRLEYETEKKKVKALQKNQARQRQVMDSLQAKIARLEQQLGETKSLSQAEAKQVETLQNERDTMKELMNSERENLEALSKLSDDLRVSLQMEKDRVKELEQAQVIAEAEAHARQINGEAAKDLEDKLVQNQLLLTVERERVSSLDEQHSELERKLENEQSKVQELEGQLRGKDALLKFERQKYENLEKMYNETNALLEAERERAESLRKDHQKIEQLLQFEQNSELCVNKSVDDAEIPVDKEVENIEATEVAIEAATEAAAETGTDAEAETATETAAEAATEDGEVMGDDHTSEDATRAVVDASAEAVGKNRAIQVEAETTSIYDMEAGLSEQAILLKVGQERLAELEESLREQQAACESERTKMLGLEERVASQQNELDAARAMMADLEEQVASLQKELNADKGVVVARDLELSETRALYNAEKRKVKVLGDEKAKAVADYNMLKVRLNDSEQIESRRRILLESEQNKVKALDHERDQIQALLDWEKKNAAECLKEQETLKSKLQEAEADISSSNQALDQEKRDSAVLKAKLVSVEEMKREIVRLNAEARQRDILIGSILQTVGDHETFTNEPSIEKARVHVSDLHRIIGLDLAGLDDNIVVVNGGERGALVSAPQRDVSRFRRIGSTLCWTIPLIPLVAYNQDPAMLQDLARNIDTSALQEPIIQMLGMAARMPASR